MLFENRYAAFQAARHDKQRKYPQMAGHYRRVTVCTSTTFLSVRLGAGTQPMSVIDQLRFGHDYCRLIRKLVVSDAIRWSSEIYVEHLTGVRKLPEGA